MYIIGSARVDENGKYSGGRDGDQKQASTPDYNGEVSMQKFYVHKKGWNIIRLKDPKQARNVAVAMVTACNNENIGYDQGGRNGVVKYGTASAVKTDADCSSLIRECFKEATGVDPGDFNTASEVKALQKTGLVDVYPYKSGDLLYTGDILVTKTKGHTVAVVKGESRTQSKSGVWEVVEEVIKGRYGNGAERKQRLEAEGYDYADIQKKVNERLKG